MTKAQFNPSTGKASFNPATGKGQFFKFDGGSGVNCTFCPLSTTPAQVQVILSGFTNQCTPQCAAVPSNTKYELDGDFASDINGTAQD
jgi:hypothetical protein